MTGRIIPLEEERRREFEALLPWYVAGGLEEAERARLKTLIAGSADCQGELDAEQRLAAAVAALPPEHALDVDSGWAALRLRIDAGGHDLGADHGPLAVRPRLSELTWLRWAVAAQFFLMVLLGAALWRSIQPDAYQTLSGEQAGAAALPGALVIMFEPQTPEAVMRGALSQVGARVVDGPTAAGAYVLHVPAPDRERTLASLRATPAVTLAELIDPVGAR